MLALNVPLIVAILLFSLRGIDFSAMTWVYFLTVVIGYYALIILVLFTLVYLLLFYVRRIAVIAAIGAITLGVFFLIVDGLTYHVTKIHIEPFWMEWIVNDLSAFGISHTTLWAVFFCLLGLIAVELLLFRLADRISGRKGLAWSFALLTVIALAASQVIHLVAYEKNVAEITSLTPYLPIYYPVTSHRNAQKYGDLLPIDEESPALASAEQTGTLSYPLKELQFSDNPGDHTPNILILLFESWRTDAMTPEVTPNTWEFSRKSTVCLDHFCSGNSTIAGLFGFFYGLHPTYWSAVKADNARIHNPVLIDALEQKGYSFGMFAKSNFKRHKIKDAVFRGIEVHESFAGKGMADQDIDMTSQLISFLGQQKDSSQPFMALGFYKANHAPFLYPPQDSLFLPAGDQNLVLATDDTDPTYYFNDYLNSTHFVDRLVGKVLNAVDSLGLMSNTIIIVTTDHAEEFNDNRKNYWGHGSNFTMYQTKIPLIMYVPGREPKKIDYRTSHIDIVPTLLQEFLGCTNDPQDYSNGENLYRLQEESRPLVIGSYVNHAFLIGDNVYEIYPFETKSYRMDDIRAKVPRPPFKKVKRIFQEISHFYQDDNIAEGGLAHADTRDTLLSKVELNP